MNKTNKLLLKMTSYFSGDPKRIQHFMKVYQYAKLIGECTGLDTSTQTLLETAAIVHDIGIKPAEAKFGSANGKLQEQEGPAAARELLASLDYEPVFIDRVCYLIAHHHTYTNVDGLDYRILLEADFLVNIYEDNLSHNAAVNAYHTIFETETGKELCRSMFGIS